MKRSSSLSRLHLPVAVCGRFFRPQWLWTRAANLGLCGNRGNSAVLCNSCVFLWKSSIGRGLSQTSPLKPPLCSICQCLSSFRVHVESHLTRQWFDLVFFFALISDFDLLFCVATTGSEATASRIICKVLA